jgi:hypothetical protein
MNTSLARASSALGIAIAASLLGARAQAACGLSDWNGSSATDWPQQVATALGRLQTTASSATATRQPDAAASIVGLWSVTFTAENNPGGPPDGTVIDAGYVTWHADHTELMNS